MHELNVCTVCGGALIAGIRKVHFSYKERSLDLDQNGLYCQNCGEGFLSPSQSRSNDKALRAFRNKVDGLLTPDQIRAVRKHLNLSQAEAGQIFGGGPMAFSKYERGECTHSRALDIVLRLLDSGAISLDLVKKVELEEMAV